MSSQLKREDKISIAERQNLRHQLDSYYKNSEDYLAFNSISHQVECWTHIEDNIFKKMKENNKRKLNILEIGAGISGFGDWLKKRGNRDNIHYYAQDVTPRNAVYLESQADYLIFEDVGKISEINYFVIIFSTTF